MPRNHTIASRDILPNSTPLTKGPAPLPTLLLHQKPFLVQQILNGGEGSTQYHDNSLEKSRTALYQAQLSWAKIVPNGEALGTEDEAICQFTTKSHQKQVLGAFGRLDLVSVFWDNHITLHCMGGHLFLGHPYTLSYNTIAAFLYSRKDGRGFN